MSISFDYNETRALAKQFRELTGRDIKHTQIIQAMATVKGMKADSLMHMLKHANEAEVENWTPERTQRVERTERVFFEGKGLLDVLRRELDLPHNPLVIMHHMVGVFDLLPADRTSIFELGHMRRAVKDALISQAADPRIIVGFLDSQHFVIAFPHIINIDSVPSLFDTTLNFIPRSVQVDNSELYFSLCGAVANVSDAKHLDEALSACKAEIPEFQKQIPTSDSGHQWDIVEWE
ncbi:hypothetical protein [Rhizobium sp. MHM7A]|uniref:hypothetical protein n=1 Tax=Rhizobium sp. MHM7A TaxID=2583233 RepID=UPI0011057A85|nr:hypothetical protein [Rhizobium sp. MHM7A]TLX16267.1 hypothetical protein FFR93_02765 [Rhizobium sp. MHM7A]